MHVTAIKKHDPNSMNSIPRIVAVAATEDYAKRWIQDEVDGLHSASSYKQYMTGRTADWWIEQRYFELVSIPLWGADEIWETLTL